MEQEIWLLHYKITRLSRTSIKLDYTSCNERVETGLCENKYIDDVIEAANLTKEVTDISYLHEERAYCPLCGSGTKMYDKGFKLPMGLEDHLLGGKGRQQCTIVASEFAIARHYWNDKFRPDEILKAQEEREKTEIRKKNETTYQTRPYGEPRLYDQGDTKIIPVIEKKLKEMEFNISHKNKVKTYTKEFEKFVVYADHTIHCDGTIVCYVYKKPIPKKNATPMVEFNHFTIQKTWKKNLLDKFNKYLNELSLIKELNK